MSTLLGLLFVSSAGAVTVVVTNPADTLTGCSTLGTGTISGGGCTLRDAITFSNANPSNPSNFIDFNIPGSGVHTISLASVLPPSTTAVVIDGYSQPGASPNTIALGDNAILLILVEGESVLTNGDAMIMVNGGNGSIVQGLVIQGAPAHYDRMPPLLGGPSISLDSCCNKVIGNFIGTDPTGSMVAVGGILVGSSRNRVGGPAPADRNVIAGNWDLGLSGDHNALEGDYIGINAAGDAALGGVGILVEGAFNVIGGLAGRGNVISGNLVGVDITGGHNLISGNFIGTDASGTLPVPNGIGVFFNGNAAGSPVIGNVVGTPPVGQGDISSFIPGNRIAFNLQEGIAMLPVQVEGSFPRGTTIRSNSIFSNGALGIDLGASLGPGGTPDGVTPNDACDTDTGPNDLQNYPVLTSATALKFTTEIQGTLNSKPSTTYDIQLFANHACDPSGFGEGETLLGDVFITTDDNCTANFTASIPVADAPVGQFITATATDPYGNTSEFSACLEVRHLLIPTRIRFLVEGPIRVAPGVPVQFRFKVEAKRSGLAGDLSGQVVVSDDQGDLCRADVSPSGEGACPLTFGAPGIYRVRAHYEGNAEFADSTSPMLVVLVGKSGGGR